MNEDRRPVAVTDPAAGPAHFADRALYGAAAPYTGCGQTTHAHPCPGANGRDDDLERA